MKQPKDIDELNEMFPDSYWLEDRGNFSRVTTEPEGSAWYCMSCGSTNCDAYENICYECGEDSDD